MATYNGAKYLQAQLDSFLRQTRLPDELVVCDDGSSDGTLEIIRKFIEKAPFKVKWEQNDTNVGVSANFNRALALTTGDLIFLSDQDDVWFESKIQTMEEVAERDQENLLFINDAALTDSCLREIGLTKLEQIRAGGFNPYKIFIMGCCSVIKRRFLDVCLPIPKNFTYHDRWVDLLAQGLRRKRIIDNVLQYSRRHKENDSHAFSSQLKKANQLNVIIHSIKFRNIVTITPYTQIGEYKTLLRKVKELKKWDPGKYNADILSFEKEIQNEINILQKRIDIRNKSRIYRFFPVWKMFIKGEYASFWGFKSAMRDIIFK